MTAIYLVKATSMVLYRKTAIADDVLTSAARKFFSAIREFPFWMNRFSSFVRASISALFSLCRLTRASAPATSFASSSVVMRACISLHQALHITINATINSLQYTEVNQPIQQAFFYRHASFSKELFFQLLNSVNSVLNRLKLLRQLVAA